MLFPVFLLLSLASVQAQHKFTRIIGPAAKFTVSWTPNIATRTLDVCFQADSDDASFIGLGFSARKGNSMNESDIVVGYTTAAGAHTVAVLYSNRTTGRPIGEATLKITNIQLTRTATTKMVCFTRPFASGHSEITNQGAVIWARGPVDPVLNVVNYHGADPIDETGQTQTHRSDEAATIPWLNGP
jgi:hypothetical protein